MEKQIQLLKKLNELAKHGVGGEKENAQQMLENLMKKYNVTFAEIEEEHIEMHEYKIKKNKFYEFLLSQVIYSVCGDKNEDKGMYSWKGRDNIRLIKCTHAEFLEIVAKYNFYADIYQNELKHFNLAFITANDIYPPDNLKAEEKKESIKNRLNMDEVIKVVGISKNLKNNAWHKQLSGGLN